MLFKEIIAVYSENHTESIDIKCKSYLMLKRLVHIATIRPNHCYYAFQTLANGYRSPTCDAMVSANDRGSRVVVEIKE
jgi:hypothetical protein